MDVLEAYIFLFKDSLLTSLMLVPRTPYVADVMLMLGKYNPYIIFIISFVAGIIGSVFNWVVGHYLRKLEKIEVFAHRSKSLEKAEVFFNNKGKWILLFSVVPLWGGFLTVAAGVMRLKLAHFIILVAFSRFVGLALEIFF
jgi:membrane protein YqaA with SNARE-associated domain